ncbi:hypothetical protein H0H92_004396 [Tricholoma furcatifolium]|nr:hypothetical protein H0H92_004396 [Tricholoma furcatifolium]
MSEASTSTDVFTSEHKAFFRTFLDEYNDYLSRPGSRKKGDKSQWVMHHVWPEFNNKFTSSVPNDMLIQVDVFRQKMKKWFINNKAQGLPVERPQASTLKPRALNAKDIYNSVKQSEWDKLAPEERNAYQERANIENEKNKHPDPSLVFARQKTLANDVLNKLKPFCGEGWEGCGAVLFVQGAFRDKSDKIQTFTSTVADRRCDLFSNSYSGYKDLRDAFCKFAENILPCQESGSSARQKTLPITSREDGFPALAPLDKRWTDWFGTAKAYIEAAWEFSNEGIAVPWEALRLKDRSSMLVPHAQVDDFETLDPDEMSAEEALMLCRRIYEFQEKKEVILQFFSVSALQKEIEEVADHDVSMDDFSTVNSSSSSKEIDFSPPIPGPPIPASNVATSSMSTSSSVRMDFSPPIPGPRIANAIPGPTPMASNAASGSQLGQPSIPLSIIVPQNALETEGAMDASTTTITKKKVTLKGSAATAPLPEAIAPSIIQVTDPSNGNAQNPSDMAQATVATVGGKGGGKATAKHGGKEKLNSQDEPVVEPHRTGRKRTRTGDSTPQDPPTKKAHIPVGERYAYVIEKTVVSTRMVGLDGSAWMD